MLEHLPRWIGGLMRNVRAGHSKLLIVQDDVLAPAGAQLDLSSPAFAPGQRLPQRCTADGEGVSPPLVWRGVPEDAAGLALIVEDPDAPAPNPLVHAIVWGLPAEAAGSLPEGAIVPDGAGGVQGDVGRNSYLREGWLPPDPPAGHGSHDYVFQLFALAELPVLGRNPGRSDLLEAITGRVLAAGLLVGTYSRGEEAPVGPAGAAPQRA